MSGVGELHEGTAPCAEAPRIGWDVDFELAKVQALLRAVLAAVDALVVFLDARGNILYLNDACALKTEYELLEVRGKPVWSAFIAPDHVESVAKTVLECAANPAHPRECVAQTAGKHGQVRHAAWTVTPCHGGNGELIGLVMVGNDQTELADMQSQLELVRELGAATFISFKETAEQKANGSAAKTPAVGPLAFEVLGRSGDEQEGKSDQRRSPRREFGFPQRIAPMYGRTIPTERKFFEVACKDISATGISFFMERPPDFDTLVVELGNASARQYLVAKVARIAKAQPLGPRRFLIGCRFTERLSAG
jgi:PAS domain S-box-containing protein